MASSAHTGEVTALLLEWGRGEKAAVDALLPLIYNELRQLAARYLKREDGGHTLQPTALVHEAYMRLVNQKSVTWQNRAHFLGVSAQMMRRILIDHARRRNAGKRGGGIEFVPLPGEDELPQTSAAIDVLALDDALTALAKIDPQQASVVEMRFFGGLSVEETAEALGISPTTVKREWRVSRAWLLRELER